MPPRRVEKDAVFLNVPYDAQFEKLYLAYIVGLTALGFVPRATLGFPSDATRISRIFKLIQTCRFSVHDLSRVQLDTRRPPHAPRFNMPFELGLAVAWAQLNPKKHTWIGCERHPYRPLKSVSDLNGTDFHIHGGTIQGVMRELCNAFVRTTKRPSVPRMVKVYQQLRVTVPDLKREAGARDLFQARVFDDLVVAAGALAEEYL